MIYDKIIGIDPGISGGLFVYSGVSDFSEAVKMPKTSVVKRNGKKRNETDVSELKMILDFHCSGYTTIIFIEKVQAWVGKDDPIRQAQIGRMLANYEIIKTIIRLSGIDYVEVMPQAWQKGLHLRVKGEESADRKKRYKRYAQSKFPNVKITGWNGDAACIMIYGAYKLQADPEWIDQNKNKI